MDPLPPLLGLLARGPQHGYQLKARAERELAPFWRLDYAQLYRALRRAAAGGAARVRVEPSPCGPARKRYALTAAGRRQFEDWLHAPGAGPEEIVVRLRLAHAAGAWSASLQARLGETLASEYALRRRQRERARAGGDPVERALADTAWRRVEAVAQALRACAAPAQAGIAIVGSDDPLLARLARSAPFALDARGSYGGLWALARGEVEVAALHLRDPDTQEYNAPFVRRMLPEDDLLLVNLAWRETGLLLPPGNPRRVLGVRDLARRRLRLANRQPAAGTRLLLHLQLRAAAIDPHSLAGWNDAHPSHVAVAEAVRSGSADVGPGLRAVAAEYGLDFLPLARERYDLVVRRRFFESPGAEALHRALAPRRLRRVAAGLSGYDLGDSGRVICRLH